MKRKIFALLTLVLVLVSLGALAETVTYAVGNLTLPIPYDQFVLTRENHDVQAAGLSEFIDQPFADSLFDSQAGLQMNSMNFDPMYEIFVFQLPVTGVQDFSTLSESELESYRSLWKDVMQQKAVELTEEAQVVTHPQTNFFYYTGTTQMNDAPVYITAYVTAINNVMTTIQLQTYDEPATDSQRAILADVVLGSVFLDAPLGEGVNLPESMPQSVIPEGYKAVTHTDGDMALTFAIPGDMQEELMKDENIDKQFTNNNMMIMLTASDMWGSLSGAEISGLGPDRESSDFEGKALKDIGISDGVIPEGMAYDIVEDIVDYGNGEHLMYSFTVSYPQEGGTSIDIPFMSYFIMRDGYLFILQFAGYGNGDATLEDVAATIMATVQYPL